MSGSPCALELPRELLEALYREARRSYPDECCGWVSGPRHEQRATRMRSCVNLQHEGAHPTQRDRQADSAYVIGGAALLQLNRELDGEEPPKLIYHSHQNGRAYLSQTDREVATSPDGSGPTYPLQQLVIGISAERVEEAALFAWSEEAGDFVEVARYAGAEI